MLDAEHAPWDRSTLDAAILAGWATGLPLFVRVADHQAAHLLQALDMGAAGVLVPHVDNAEMARRAVSHARFIGGNRGYSGSPRFGGYGSLAMNQTLRRGDQAVVVCQIESWAAVEQADAIAAVPGVDGVFIGRADLALSMGLETPEDPPVDDAAERVMQATAAAGKTIGIAVGSTSMCNKTWCRVALDQ